MNQNLQARYKLSVIVTTYNDEQFIERCLNSILSQKTDFAFEVLVGDDASTDGTHLILKKISANHPDTVKVFYRKENLGTSGNFIDLVYRASGEYIAQVDGDDMLMDEPKFQMQSDFLDAKKECSICFHHFIRQDADGKKFTPRPRPFQEDTITDLKFLLIGNMGAGNTTMFRRDALPNEAPQWLRDCGNHKDYALHFLVACKGLIGYINKDLSYATLHSNNITYTEPKENLLKNSILINQGLLDYQIQLGIIEHRETFRWIINHRKLRLAFFYLEQRRLFSFLVWFFRGIFSFRYWNSDMLKESLYFSAPKTALKLKEIQAHF